MTLYKISIALHFVKPEPPKKEDGLVLVHFIHSIAKGRLPADIHPLEPCPGRSQTSNFNFLFSFMPFFLLRSKKKGQKEGRRSNAAGLLFREPLQWRKRETLP